MPIDANNSRNQRCTERNSLTEKTGQNSRRASRNFVLLLVIIFMLTFASSMIAASPVYFLIQSFAKTESATSAAYATLLSIGSVAIILANFLGGFLAERIGRRKVIVIGSAVLAPSLFAYSLVPNIAWMWAVFFIETFAIQMFQPSFQALVADSSGTSSRGKAFGNFNLFWIGSQIPAPLLGGFLIDTVGLRFPFLLASAISLVGLVTAFGLVEVTRPQAAAHTVTSEDSIQVEEPTMPFTQVILIFGVMAVLNGLLNGMLSPLLRLHLVYNLHTTPTELGLAFSIGSGLVTTLVQIPGGMLTDSVGRKPLMLFSMLGAPFVVAMAFTGTVSQFILATAGLVAFGNLSAPAYYAWMMDLVPSTKRARISGIMNTITGIGLFIGPQLSNWIYTSQGNIVLAFFVTAMPWILQTPLILMLTETKTSG